MKKKKSSVLKIRQESELGEGEEEEVCGEDLDHSLKRAWRRRLEGMIVDQLPVALRDIEDMKVRLLVLEEGMVSWKKILLEEGVRLNGHLRMHKFV